MPRVTRGLVQNDIDQSSLFNQRDPSTVRLCDDLRVLDHQRHISVRTRDDHGFARRDPSPRLRGHVAGTGFEPATLSL